jgi:hypothetical protein
VSPSASTYRIRVGKKISESIQRVIDLRRLEIRA